MRRCRRHPARSGGVIWGDTPEPSAISERALAFILVISGTMGSMTRPNHRLRWRTAWLLVLALVAVESTAGCSPAVTAVSAIGYDNGGRLIGGMRVCNGAIARAHLTPSVEGSHDLASWQRHPVLKGTETWPLDASGTGSWQPGEPAGPSLASNVEYVFWGSNANDGKRSDFLVFHGSDLAKLSPGQLLVAREGPTTTQDETTTRLAVISLTDLAKESCRV